MDKRDKFEQKIKEKLEGIATPVPDLDQAWQNFSPKISEDSIPFWKRWYMPYLFASTLFIFSLWWHQREQKGDFVAETSFRNELSADTVVVRDTVYLVDTVYLIKKIIVQENQVVQSQSSFSEKENEQQTALSQSKIGEQNLEYQTDEPKEAEKSNKDQLEALNKSSRSVGKSDSSTLGSEKRMAEPVQGVDSLTQKSWIASQPDSIAPKRPRSMTAPSIGPKEKVVLKSDVELLVGDTSNLSNPSIRARSKPMLHVEAVSSILFPISRLVEYYTLIQNGIQVGMEWESGWGIYTGAIRNQVEGELDDEEIMQLSSAVISNLPNLTADISSLDEIYFTNRQWFFPLELRWRSLYYSGFSFESSLGLMGNLLSRQDFIYEFENNFVEEYQYETVDKNQFSLSHFRLGIGTNYLLSKRVGMSLRSHYWFPTARPGIIRDRMHGLEVGVGINVLLGK